jgi:hypothetical protein
VYQDKLALENLISAMGSTEQYDHESSIRTLTHNYNSLSAYQKLLESNRAQKEELDLLRRKHTQTERELADANSARTPPLLSTILPS